MSEQDSINPISMSDPKEDDLNRAVNNIQHLMYHIDRRLDEISNAVEANSAQLDILEEAIATITPIPARRINLKYDHDNRQLWVNERYYIPFEGRQEARLLGELFIKESGKPSYEEVLFDDLLDDYQDFGTGVKPTRSALSQAAHRIRKKIEKELHVEKVLIVTTVKMYFSDKTIL